MNRTTRGTLRHFSIHPVPSRTRNQFNHIQPQVHIFFDFSVILFEHYCSLLGTIRFGEVPNGNILALVTKPKLDEGVLENVKSKLNK